MRSVLWDGLTPGLLEPGRGQLLYMWFHTSSVNEGIRIESLYLSLAVVTHNIPKMSFRNTCNVLQRV